MASLIVKKKSELLNHMQDFEIYIDGKLAGKISNNETKTYHLKAGKHSITAKTKWYKSQVIAFELEKEDRTFELDKFKYGNVLSIIAPIFMCIYFVAKYFFDTDSPALIWFSLLALPYPIYLITIGKNKFLKFKELR